MTLLANASRHVLHFGDVEGEDCERFVVLPDGFIYPDVKKLARRLKAKDVFVPGYGPPKVGLYHPDGFIYERQVDGIESILLPDLNVVADWVQLAQGAIADGTRSTSAAILAFCQHLDIDVEPSIACHELAHKNGNDLAFDKLGWVRAADNGELEAWRDVGLGRLRQLPHLLAKHAAEHIAADLAKPLRRWRRNYIVTLKIGELELFKGTNIERMLGLMDWMRDDFIVAGPAALLATFYFAPNSPPRDGLLKALRSPNRQRAIEGAKNTAWDITYLSEFISKVNQHSDGRKRFIFASHDQGLLSIAKLLFEVSENGLDAGLLTKALSALWPAQQAHKITSEFERLFSVIGDPSRPAMQRQEPGFIDRLISEGEAVITAWRPTHEPKNVG